LEEKSIKDGAEHEILAALQNGLPVTATPYRDLARQSGVSVDRLLTALRSWQESGTLRRIGAIVNHVRVGVNHSAMVVWRVPEDRRGEVGTLFAGFPQVSHAYERRTLPTWPYSIYTMVHGDTPERVRETIRCMSQAAGVADYVTLPTCRELKKTAPRYVD
jgi:DNA-binding Lrp family transcriptional regulator